MIQKKRFMESVKNAFRGIALVYKSEQSFRIQVIIGLFVLFFALLFDLRSTQFILIVLLIAVVLVLELINSVLERMIDAFKPRLHPTVRDAKDMMAGAVLIASIISIIVGLVIFAPHIHALF